MKTLIPVFSIFLFLIYGCDNSIDQEELIGRWEVVDFQSNVQISPHIIEGAKSLALSTSFIFNKDKTFSVISDYPKKRFGKYQFISETGTIKLIYNDGIGGGSRINVFTIESLDGNSMKLSEKFEDSQSNTYWLVKK